MARQFKRAIKYLTNDERNCIALYKFLTTSGICSDCNLDMRKIFCVGVIFWILC